MKVEATAKEVTGEVWCDACTFPIERILGKKTAVQVAQTIQPDIHVNGNEYERTEWFWFHQDCYEGPEPK